MSPLLQQILQELAQLSAEEQLEVIAQATSHLKRRSANLLSGGAQIETMAANPLGLFSGSANLPTQSENILQSVRPQRKWSDLKGMAPYAMTGEDAQVWVSRSRCENDQYREHL